MEILPRYKFDQLVADALDDLPAELVPVLDNVVVQVFDRHPDEPDLLGLYEGTPHTERFGDEVPDLISIYRHALTGEGRQWALDALVRCKYTGPAPVPLAR